MLINLIIHAHLKPFAVCSMLFVPIRNGLMTISVVIIFRLVGLYMAHHMALQDEKINWNTVIQGESPSPDSVYTTVCCFYYRIDREYTSGHYDIACILLICIVAESKETWLKKSLVSLFQQKVRDDICLCMVHKDTGDESVYLTDTILLEVSNLEIKNTSCIGCGIVLLAVVYSTKIKKIYLACIYL